jgi:uncharacterized membrane protein
MLGLKPMKNRLSLAIILPLFAVFCLWVNLFFIGPVLVSHGYTTLNTLLYVGFRLVIFIALAFVLVRFVGRNRPQAMSSVLLVGAVDQVLLKGLWMQADVKAHPELWVGVKMDSQVMFTGLAQGYLFFVPFVLILAFLGTELTRFRADLKRERDLALKPLRSQKSEANESEAKEPVAEEKASDHASS